MNEYWNLYYKRVYLIFDENTQKIKSVKMLTIPLVVNTEQRLHSLSVVRTAQEMG